MPCPYYMDYTTIQVIEIGKFVKIGHGPAAVTGDENPE